MAYTAAVITISDKGYRGEREDTSGPNLVKILTEKGFDVTYTAIVPDEAEMIQSELLKCADEKKIALVLTTGSRYGGNPASDSRYPGGYAGRIHEDHTQRLPEPQCCGHSGTHPDHYPARQPKGIGREYSGGHRPGGPWPGYALQRGQCGLCKIKGNPISEQEMGFPLYIETVT